LQTWTKHSTCENYSDAIFSITSANNLNCDTWLIHISWYLYSFPLWTVTWTTIQLVGISQLNFQDYQVYFTCKFATFESCLRLQIKFISILSLSCWSCLICVNLLLTWQIFAAFWITTTYQELFRQSYLTFRIYLYCMALLLPVKLWIISLWFLMSI
jgi:hypothetical protein